jgi:hypothetical protein
MSSERNMDCEYTALSGIAPRLTVSLSSLEQTGMAFLGIGLGQILAVLSQPYFNKYVMPFLRRNLLINFRRYRAAVKASGGTAPPEVRLVPGFYGAILAPVGVLLFGLTSFVNVPWIIPILCSSLFGAGMVFAFTSTFTYLVE